MIRIIFHDGKEYRGATPGSIVKQMAADNRLDPRVSKLDYMLQVKERAEKMGREVDDQSAGQFLVTLWTSNIAKHLHWEPE